MPKILLTVLLSTALAGCASISEKSPDNRYVETRLVANKAAYGAQTVDNKLINAWGIAIRPKGAGGHFWVTGKDISFEYVGDVKESPDATLRTLHTDALKYVTLPVGGAENMATGVVFSGSTDNFVITQNVKGTPPITAPAKFLFASDGGIISAWLERKNLDGTTDWPTEAKTVIDASAAGSQFFGIALNKDYSRLYAADFGKNPKIQVFDGKFQPLAISFDLPFDDNHNGKVDAGEYAPFNIQRLDGSDSLFVAYAKTQACPKGEACTAGEIFAGEEDTSEGGMGRLAEFDDNGKLLAVWEDAGRLSAPWGLAIAPADFGALSDHLLVANFGDGQIAAFDRTTRRFKDFVRGADGKPVIIDKIWGLQFGNGSSLGDSNALYYAAGPNDEKDGLFGSLRVQK